MLFPLFIIPDLSEALNRVALMLIFIKKSPRLGEKPIINFYCN
uniref:Uncharacterized protein n=1 Tax=Arundo donax TaxID=35708 RepID=A0A0A8ZUX5_ARUDO